MNEALELFGVDRMMFGSDYPVCLLASSYDRVLGSFQEILKISATKIAIRFFPKRTKFYRLT